MKITNKNLCGRVYIDDVEVGGVFFIEDTDNWGTKPFLKLDPRLSYGSDWEEGNYALSLKDYTVYEIGYSEPLRKVESELILT